MTILLLCREQDLAKEPGGYARAFRRSGARVVCIEPGFPLNGDVSELLQSCLERPALILHPECLPVLPRGLTEVNIPTACFHVDTYAYFKRRIVWSMLFDYPIAFHPGFDAQLQEAGHPHPLLVPHAVESSLFAQAERDRVFEVGWIGQTGGTLYRERARLLPALARLFQMNNWKKRYLPEEMAQIYMQSKIIVNIGRDDYPEDANLRTFEAMAAGALLLTSLPSELTQLGFEDGKHFLGFRSGEEIPSLVRRYLSDEPARRQIAEAAREKVLREHTYDVRVQTLLENLEKDAGKFFAPARQWPDSRVRLTYLDYFAANGVLDRAAAELREIAQHSMSNAARGAALLGRAWAKAAYRRTSIPFRREKGTAT